MSKIEWTTATWNPVTGCTSFSKECDNCYAEVMSKRLQAMGRKKYEKGFDVVAEHEYELNKPNTITEPTTFFVNSMSDLFHKDVSLDFIKKVFRAMNFTPRHTYQVLTKRDRKLLEYSNELDWTDNIWMGVSVGSQGSTRKIPQLVNSNAKNKFLSIEPFIEEINDIDLNGIDWVIVGGESGSGARPIKKEWIEFIKGKCDESSIPFFFKQWGDKKWNPNPNDPTMNKHHRYYVKGGCQLDGKIYWTNPTIPNFEMPTINLFGEDYYVMDEVNNNDVVSIWELKSYLPFADDNKFKELQDDIRIHGMHDPILYWVTPNGDKLVIEGHTRIMACPKGKINDIPAKEIKENFTSLEDIKFWMVSHQLQRRNLTNAQRLEYAYKLKETIVKKAKENLSRGGKGEEVDNSIDTYKEIAKLAGVGRTTAVRYDNVITKGSASTIDNLYRGKISINSAYNKVKDIALTPSTQPNETEKPKEPQIITFQSIEEGIAAFQNVEIEDFLITRYETCNQILKKKIDRKIGVFYEDGS